MTLRWTAWRLWKVYQLGCLSLLPNSNCVCMLLSQDCHLSSIPTIIMSKGCHWKVNLVLSNPSLIISPFCLSYLQTCHLNIISHSSTRNTYILSYQFDLSFAYVKTDILLAHLSVCHKPLSNSSLCILCWLCKLQIVYTAPLDTRNQREKDKTLLDRVHR